MLHKLIQPLLMSQLSNPMFSDCSTLVTLSSAPAAIKMTDRVSQLTDHRGLFFFHSSTSPSSQSVTRKVVALEPVWTMIQDLGGLIKLLLSDLSNPFYTRIRPTLSPHDVFPLRLQQDLGICSVQRMCLPLIARTIVYYKVVCI